MSENTEYQFYCLSVNNEERKQNMQRRFNTANINCNIYEGVYFDDSRIKVRLINDGTKKVWSCMYGHLDMIRQFYNSDKQIGIFCEDDIYIHINMKNLLPKIIDDFNSMKLDILLLGYLLPFKPYNSSPFEIKYNSFNSNGVNYTYHEYPNDLWGTQMYMLSKTYAKYILDKYESTYADETLLNSTLTPFSADWIITKDTYNKALISPLLAVEDGKSNYNHYVQQQFHNQCHTTHFEKDLFII